VKRAWAEASAAYRGGDVAKAIQTGREAEARAETLATKLGLAVSPPPVQPTASPPPPTPSPATPAP
jgi:hypothetical protein